MDDRRNPELRRFLQSRRSRITPEEAGLRSTGPRRVRGLRREEVAQLAGVSVDYYVRLERGKKLTASDAVLNALARALQLDETERDHLFTIARPVQRAIMPPQHVRPELQRILDGMPDLPAMVMGRRLDVLATNRLARALYADFDALPERDRNMARFVFLDERARSIYQNWELGARMVLSALHLYAGRWPDDPRLVELVAELSSRSREFDQWWAVNDVARQSHGSKALRHPVVGELVLSYETFTATGDPEQMLGVYTPEPGSPSAEALRELAVLAAGPAASALPVQVPSMAG
ncbi:Helix-turn-helix domain-containing protein [Lentzea xinjiangensis]|uniref:Helix-turn-helix domain-containing protein n=1 Tax=Lentzea xinjiangensis TaxID=402600 RepID=A0A1H9UEG5_9PSEU|nr:helix-turn-helix transcriptional regulator [Lentzea xinjiangensis]SES07557.1 Helix-turn-helix domain-containing protein [Lentzea xinjiangensis]